jgi:hypothetical protein
MVGTGCKGLAAYGKAIHGLRGIGYHGAGMTWTEHVAILLKPDYKTECAELCRIPTLEKTQTTG